VYVNVSHVSLNMKPTESDRLNELNLKVQPYS